MMIMKNMTTITRMFILLLVSLLFSLSASALEYDENKSVTRNQAEALIAIANWGGDWLQAYEDVAAASYTLQAGDKILGVSYSATGATSVILATLEMKEGRLLLVKDIGGNADPNTITVSTEGEEKIDGADTQTITSDYGILRLFSNGTNWFTW